MNSQFYYNYLLYCCTIYFSPRYMKLSKKLLVSYGETDITLPYIEYNSWKPGNRIAIISGVHGDEINWIKIIYDFIDWFDENIWETYTWTILFVPIVNILGYMKWRRRVPVDNVDLNRSFFVAKPKSFSTYFAQQFFDEILKWTDAVIDIHDAWERDVLPPHSRFFPNDPVSRIMAELLWTKIAIKRKWKKWMLAKYLEKHDIPSLTVEVGGNKRYSRNGQKLIHVWLIRILDHFWIFNQSYELPNLHDICIYTKRYGFKAACTWLVEVYKELQDVVVKWETVWLFFDPIQQKKVPLISPVTGIVFSIWTANSIYAWAKIISFLVTQTFPIEEFSLGEEYEWLCTFDNCPM
jgi:predicted deacylase